MVRDKGRDTDTFKKKGEKQSKGQHWGTDQEEKKLVGALPAWQNGQSY